MADRRAKRSAHNCPLRRWEVSVLMSSGWVSDTVTAKTRGKALADTWRSDAFSGSSFGEFMRYARCRVADEPEWWGAPITVLDKPAHYLGHNSQYVEIVYPDGDFALHAHPYDVLPITFRPKAYQDRERVA